MGNNDIFISVVITAFNRREYLLNALESVLIQTLPREKYEIIVIKNFYDSSIDEVLQKKCVLNIYEPDPDFIKIIKTATEYSSSNLISFLDDDDEFFENKLERIFTFFNTDKSIIYLHNGHLAIGSKGENLNFSVTPITYDNITLESRSSFSEIARFQKIGGFFNSSSISIDKKFFSKILNDNPELKLYANLDAFMFIAALNTELKLVHINEKLTKYRIHGKNMSGDKMENGQHNTIRYLEKSYNSYFSLAKLSKFEKGAKLMYMLSFESFLRMELTGKLISKKMTLINSIKLFIFSLSFKSLYRVILAFIGLLFTMSPDFSKLIYKKYLDITIMHY